MTGSSHRVPGLLTGLLLLSTAGCAPQASAKENADLLPYVVAQVPETATRTFVDFGAKLQLVGYEINPSGKAGPGESVSVKLYWRSVGKLGKGWGLFTHLEDESGKQLWNFNREGAFRGFVSGKMPEGLSLLGVGSIYMDEQTLTMPKAEQLSPTVSLVIGVWNDTMRLPVLGSTSNGKNAAIVAHFETGVTKVAPAKQQAKPQVKAARQ